MNSLASVTTIRKLTFQDIEPYRDLRIFALQSHPESFGASPEEEKLFTRSDWERRIAVPDSSDFVFGAWSDETLVGVTGFFRQVREKVRHKGMVWGVFVHPDFRGKGIGRRLVQSTLTQAESQSDLSVIQLCVAQSNKEAHALYLSLGFVEYGIEPFARRLNSNYISEIHMWRPAGGGMRQ